MFCFSKLRRPVVLFCLYVCCCFTSVKATPRDVTNVDKQSTELSFRDIFRAPDYLTRRLQDPPPQQTPLRVCGEIIGTSTRAEINETLAQIGAGFFAPVSPELQALFQSLHSVKYGIQARKICTSCQEMAESWAGSDFVTDDSPNGFATYCGPDAFGYNVTISGLLLVPIDEETGELVKGSLKTTIFGRTIGPQLQRVLSERWPRNMADLGLNNLSGPDLSAASGNLYDLVAPMAAATAGTVVLAPDNLGFGESYNATKSWLVKATHQASGSALRLFAMKLLASETSQCTVLSTGVITTGYSAGGYSSIAVASAMRQMDNADVLSVSVGGAPTRLSSAHLVVAAGNIDTGLTDVASLHGLVSLAYSYSSTNPVLANTNVDGQNYLSDEYISNATEWIESGLRASTIVDLLPENPLDIVNQGLVPLALDAYDKNETDICVAQIENNGTYATLCQVLTDNDLTEELHSADYPVSFCHSPGDFLVPIENLPDFDSNPDFLSVFDAIPGFAPSGNHAEAGGLCLIPLIYPFANPTLTAIEPATECTTTPQPTTEPNNATPPPSSSLPPSGAPSLSNWKRHTVLVSAIIPLFLMSAL